MKLKVNQVAKVDLRENGGAAEVIVKETRPAEKKYCLVVYNGDYLRGHEYWLSENDFDILDGPKDLGTDIREWPACVLGAYLMSELYNLNDIQSRAPQRYHSPADEAAVEGYKTAVSAFFNHGCVKDKAKSINRANIALDARNKLFAGRVIPVEKTISRSTKRRLRRKEKIRNNGRGRGVKYYLPPEPEKRAAVANSPRNRPGRSYYKPQAELRLKKVKHNKKDKGKTDDIPF